MFLGHKSVKTMLIPPNTNLVPKFLGMPKKQPRDFQIKKGITGSQFT
jgi:hypothetical protein